MCLLIAHCHGSRGSHVYLFDLFFCTHVAVNLLEEHLRISQFLTPHAPQRPTDEYSLKTKKTHEKTKREAALRERSSHVKANERPLIRPLLWTA